VVGSLEGKEVGGLSGLGRVDCGCGHGISPMSVMHVEGYAVRERLAR
jgi:hypothetical protein